MDLSGLRRATARLKTLRLKLPVPGDLFCQSSKSIPTFSALRSLEGELCFVTRTDVLIVVNTVFEKVDDKHTFRIVFFSSCLQRLLTTLTFDEADPRKLFDHWFEVIQ